MHLQVQVPQVLSSLDEITLNGRVLISDNKLVHIIFKQGKPTAGKETLERPMPHDEQE